MATIGYGVPEVPDTLPGKLSSIVAGLYLLCKFGCICQRLISYFRHNLHVAAHSNNSNSVAAQVHHRHEGVLRADRKNVHAG